MTELSTLRILLLAIDALTVSSAVPVLAWLATRAFARRASVRHLIWLTAACCLLLLPILTATFPAQVTFRLAPAVAGISATVPAKPFHKVDAAHPSIDVADVLFGLLGIWSLGVGALTVRGLVAGWALAGLRRRSAPYAVCGVKPRSWELRLSHAAAGPMTWGVIHPTILLPAQAVGWPPERMRTVLAHELAHVRRRDGLAQALAMTACAFYWPNPLVWLATRALRRDAEIAADDAVIASGIRPSDYADTLLSITRQAQGQLGALTMAAPSTLTHRVSSILSPNPIRTGVTTMDAIKIAVVGAAATAALALARPGIAQQRSAAAPPEAPTAVQQLLAEASTATAVPAKPAVERPRIAHPATQPQGDAAIPESARIGEDVRKAIADAHINEAVAKAIAEKQAGNDTVAEAQLQRTMAELQPRVQKAIADAHIDNIIARHMAQMQPRIDAAIARAQEAAEKAKTKSEAKHGIGAFTVGVDPVG